MLEAWGRKNIAANLVMAAATDVPHRGVRDITNNFDRRLLYATSATIHRYKEKYRTRSWLGRA